MEQWMMEFKVYQAMTDGHHVEVRFNGQETLWKDKVFIIAARDARRVFIWVGSEANVRDKFAGSRIAERLRREVGMNCRIVTVDEGQEPNEFLEVVNLPRRSDGPADKLLTADEIRNQAEDKIGYIAAEKQVIDKEPIMLEKERKDEVPTGLTEKVAPQAKETVIEKTVEKKCSSCREQKRYGLDNSTCMSCNRNPLFIKLNDNWKPL